MHCNAEATPEHLDSRGDVTSSAFQEAKSFVSDTGLALGKNPLGARCGATLQCTSCTLTEVTTKTCHLMSREECQAKPGSIGNL